MSCTEGKLDLVYLETETRMRIAELAAQLSVVPGQQVIDRKQFMETYHEICNEVLTSLIEAKEECGVPPVPIQSSILN